MKSTNCFPFHFNYVKVHKPAFFSMFTMCATSPLSNTNILWSPQKGPQNRQQSYPVLPSSSRWQPLIYLLFLWICLFWTFHIHRILEYVTFCVYPFSIISSRLSVLWHVSVLYSFSWPDYAPVYGYTNSLFIHQLMDICITFYFFWLP